MALQAIYSGARALAGALASHPTIAKYTAREAFKTECNLATLHTREEVEKEGERAMARAVDMGNAALAEVVLNANALSRNALQRHLYAACGKGHREIVKRFYAHGVMPDLEACAASALYGEHEGVVVYLLSLPRVYGSFEVVARDAPPSLLEKLKGYVCGPKINSPADTLELAVRKRATSIFEYLFFRYKDTFEKCVLEDLAVEAVKHNNLTIFHWLVERGGVSVFSDSAFYKLRYLAHACAYGRVEILDYLHTFGVPVADDEDCFRLAVEGGHMDVVERLTQLGAKFRAKSPRESFITACALGRLAGVKYMISRELIDVREVGSAGFHEANRNGHFHVSEHLLLSAAQFTPYDLMRGLVDATGRNFALFKHLHQRGASPYDCYTSILCEAARHGDIETLKYCAAHGARPSCFQLIDGLTAAAKHDSVEVFQYFREDYNRLVEGYLADLLEHAARCGSRKVATFIVNTSDIDRAHYGNRIARAAKKVHDKSFRTFLRDRGFRVTRWDKYH